MADKNEAKKSKEIWLVGYPSDTLNSTKLPSKKDVMKLLMHFKTNKNQTTREASTSTAVDVMAVWGKARIPSRDKKHVVEKVENFFKDWVKLKKNKNTEKKNSEFLKQKEQKWKEDLEDLFDIAHADALNRIQNKEDRDLLTAEREKVRKGKIGSVTKTKKEERSRKRKDLKGKKIIEEKNKKLQRKDVSKLTESSESKTKVEPILKKHKIIRSASPSTSITKTTKRGKLMGDKLSVSLDRAKLGNRVPTLKLVPLRIGIE